MHAPRLALGRALALPPKRPRVLTAAIVRPRRRAGGAAGGGQPRARRGAAALPSRRRGRSGRTRRWRGCGPTRGAAGAKLPGARAGDVPRRGADALPLAAAARGRALRAAGALPLRESSGSSRSRLSSRDERRRALGGAIGAAALIAAGRPAPAEARLRWTGCGGRRGGVRARVRGAARPLGRGCRGRAAAASRALARRAAARRCSTSPAARAAPGCRSSPTCCSRSAG